MDAGISLNILYSPIIYILLQPIRTLSLHEYISQDLMSKYGVCIPEGELATSPTHARDIALGLGLWNVI